MAFKTFSGVMGRSEIRTPIASNMAFPIAGKIATDAPSPTSLAPNGPSGSMLSHLGFWKHISKFYVLGNLIRGKPLPAPLCQLRSTYTS